MNGPWERFQNQAQQPQQAQPEGPWTRFAQPKTDSLQTNTMQQVAGPVPTKQYFKDMGSAAVKGATLQNLTPEEEQTPGMQLGHLGGSVIPMGVATAMAPEAVIPNAIARSGVAGMIYGAAKGAVNQTPPLETVKNMGKEGLGFMTGEGLAKVAGKAFAPFSGSVTPEIQAATDTALKEGIKPPLSTMTNNKYVQGAEAMAESSPFFGNRITKIRDSALAGLKSFTDKIADNIGPHRPSEVSGNLAKERLIQLPQVFDETKNQLYDAVMPILKDAPIKVDNTVHALDDIIARRSSELEPSGLQKLRNFRDSLTSKDANLATFEPGKSPKITTFGKMKIERTNLNPMIKSWNDPASTGLQDDLKGLYGAMSNDMDAAASAVSPEAKQGIDAANAFNKKAMDTLKGEMYKAITANRVKPENVYKVVIQPNNPGGIEIGKELLGDNFKDIARQWWQGIITDTSKDGPISPIKLVKKLNSYGSTIDALFADQPEILKKINDAKIASGLLARGREMTQGSRTAPVLNAGRAMGEMAFAIQQLLSGNFKTAGAMGLTMGAEGLGVAGMSSDAGRQYLTTGFPKVGKAVEETVAPVAKAGLSKYLNKK